MAAPWNVSTAMHMHMIIHMHTGMHMIIPMCITPMV